MKKDKARSAEADMPVCNHAGGVYEIRIKGYLDEHWLDWFEGMTLRTVKNRKTGLVLTVLRGTFADQPALHGLLAKIRDLNLTLISVTKPGSVNHNSSRPRPRKRKSRSKSQ